MANEQKVAVTNAHRARRIKREAILQAKNIATRGRRLILRKRGAVARIERRLAAASSDASRASLTLTRSKVIAALRRVEAA